MSEPFYSRESLQVETYELVSTDIPGGDDVTFFRTLAEQTEGAVLELGCGSGRVTIAIAMSGKRIVGMDRSRAMLARAEQKRQMLPSDARERLELLDADMTTFAIEGEFSLIFAAYRVFMSLPDVASQRATLARVRDHLAPGGLVVLDVFDPLLDRFTPERRPASETSVRHPITGNLVVISSAGRMNDPVSQTLCETMTYRELDAHGQVLREEVETLRLRWTYRHELAHLLELEGFVIERELGDYAGGRPRYGGEIIVMARRRG